MKVIIAEDGGDPAKHRSLVQSLVEQERVIAFIHGFTADMPAAAGQFGLKVVSQAQASLAQPDNTAECLAARNAGASFAT